MLVIFLLSSLLLLPCSVHAFALSNKKITALQQRRHVLHTANIVDAPITADSASVVTTSDKGTSLMLCLTYMSIIVSVMPLSACLPSLSVEKKFLTSSFGMPGLVSLGTFVVFLGKILLGPPTDYYGGINILKASMLFITMALFGCSLSGSMQVFALQWIAICFAYSSAWGAVSKVVREKYQEKEWSEQLGLVAASSRLGSMLSTIFFGFVLGKNGDWRMVYKSAGVIQGVILALSLLLERKNSKAKVAGQNITNTKKMTLQTAAIEQRETIPQVLKRVSAIPSFWLMLIAKTVLMTVGQIILFIPMFLVSTQGIAMKDASIYAGSFALGSLISSVGGSKIYEKLSKLTQLKVITLFNSLGCFFSWLLYLQVKGVVSLPLTFVIASLFMWGLGWSLPFYVPPGKLALSLGGRDHAALLTNIYDGFGFLAAAVFSYHGMIYAKLNQWNGIMTLMYSLGLVSTGAMTLSMYLDNKKEK
jgi:MFS family permease